MQEALSATESTAANLYLNLLTKSLTNTLYEIEPDTNQASETSFVSGFIRHYIQGPAVSMLPLARFENLRLCIENVLADRVPGDFIETGVWRGGATIFMRAMLKLMGITDRTVWVADSFEGLPAPDAEKFPVEAKTHSGPVMNKIYKHFAASLEEVQTNFTAYGMLDDQVRFLKGWFKDTLPTAPVQTIAIMRLDGDYYDSTMDGLTNLWAKLSPGGYVIVDDYGEDTWTYCRRAVDEFRAAQGIATPMIQIDSKCFYWRRSH